MKKTTYDNNLKKIALVACIPALMASSPSFAAENGWYIGSYIGSFDVDDVALNSNSQVNGVQSSRNLAVGSDSDTGFGFTSGYRFEGSQFGAIRIEGELHYSKHDVDSINFNGNQFSESQGFVDGDIETTSLFINAVQEFDGLISDKVRPYIGVGIGLTEFYGDFRYNPNLSARVDDDDTALSYQIFLGLDLDLTEKITGFIDYHFVKTDDFDLDRFGGGAGGPASTSQNGDIDLDALTVGLRYSF